jgi:hypothetical protein
MQWSFLYIRKFAFENIAKNYANKIILQKKN